MTARLNDATARLSDASARRRRTGGASARSSVVPRTGESRPAGTALGQPVAGQPGHPQRTGRPAPFRTPRGPTVPPALAVAAAWGWRILVIGVVGYFLVTFLASTLSLVMVPILISLLFTALLHRPVLLLRRLLPRWLAGLIVVVLAICVLGGVLYFIGTRVAGQSGELVNRADEVLAQLRSRVAGLPGVGAGSASVVDRLTSWVQSHSSTVLTSALAAGRVAVDLVVGVVLTVFLTLFFLIDGDRVWSWLFRLLPVSARPAANGAGHRAFHVLSGWISGTTIIALIHGVVIGATLWLLGTPLVVVLALLVFIGSYVPIIGAFVFGGFSVLVTLVTVGLGPAAILLGVLLLENLLEGHVYQPLIMGRTVRLHPVAILLALAAGGLLGGIVGAIVAIPLVGAVHAAVKYLTGIEDINGDSLREEDRMQPVEPPEVAGAWVRSDRRAAS